MFAAFSPPRPIFSALVKNLDRDVYDAVKREWVCPTCDEIQRVPSDAGGAIKQAPSRADGVAQQAADTATVNQERTLVFHSGGRSWLLVKSGKTGTESADVLLSRQRRRRCGRKGHQGRRQKKSIAPHGYSWENEARRLRIVPRSEWNQWCYLCGRAVTKYSIRSWDGRGDQELELILMEM